MINETPKQDGSIRRDGNKFILKRSLNYHNQCKIIRKKSQRNKV